MNPLYTFALSALGDNAVDTYAVHVKQGDSLDKAEEQLRDYATKKGQPCTLTLYKSGELRLRCYVHDDARVFYRAYYTGSDTLAQLDTDDAENIVEAIEAACDTLRDNI